MGTDECPARPPSSSLLPPSSASSFGPDQSPLATSFSSLALLYILLVLVILLVFTVIVATRHIQILLPFQNDGTQERTVTGAIDTTTMIPFVVLSSDEHRLQKSLSHVLTGYRIQVSQALEGLSQMLERALAVERDLGLEETEFDRAGRRRRRSSRLLSNAIRERIKRLAVCLEEDERVLAKLLGGFQYVMVLPDREAAKPLKMKTYRRGGDFRKSRNPTTAFQWDATTSGGNINGEAIQDAWDLATFNHSYDSATQIVAHLVRDWTVEGRHIRRNIYDWCCEQVTRHASMDTPVASSVLVPGAGMGRLAYDLFRRGHRVEANELSVSMAAAAASILQGRMDSGVLHPFALDVLANEVEADRRYDTVSFPDSTNMSLAAGERLGKRNDASLSYTVGDFGSNQVSYYSLEKMGHFEFVVTCFFLDTAHSIYDYITTIHGLLKSKGVWINVGPVQWHQNALFRPSVDELRDLIESGFGFQIKHWSIDKDPITYRSDSDGLDVSKAGFVRMTNYEGYRPLRFVAVRSS